MSNPAEGFTVPVLPSVILAAMQNGAEDVGPEMAQRVYRAIQDHLPLYEDVYDQCCDLIEPYVARVGRPGPLPASVVESLQLLLQRTGLGKPSLTPTRAKARAALITQAIQRASICTPYSQESLMVSGVFSGTPSNAIACELAEQILELQEQLAGCLRHGGLDA